MHQGINTSESTLVDFLLEKFPEIKNVGDAPDIRPGIVHRLDKETSGVMIVARNQKTFDYLKNLFRNRKVEKKYLALVHGKLKEKVGKIEGEMGRSKRDFRRQSLARGKIKVRKERYSLTYYKVKKEFDDFSLLEVFPKTGRMHQIRVHLHAIGHPIVGDKKYTFNKYLPRRPASTRGKQAGKKEKYQRMFLHASKLSLIDQSGKPRKFKSPPPEIFQKFLSCKNTSQ